MSGEQVSSVEEWLSTAHEVQPPLAGRVDAVPEEAGPEPEDGAAPEEAAPQPEVAAGFDPGLTGDDLAKWRIKWNAYPQSPARAATASHRSWVRPSEGAATASRGEGAAQKIPSS